MNLIDTINFLCNLLSAICNLLSILEVFMKHSMLKNMQCDFGFNFGMIEI